MYSFTKMFGLAFLPVIFFISGSHASNLYYRTVNSGTWNDLLIWQTAEDILFTVNSGPALKFPDQNDRAIFIRNGHTVTITESLGIDETIVETGGALIYGNYPSSLLTLFDGPGIDLEVNGTFEDSGPFTIGWNSSAATWVLGENATMIRTRSTSATVWRDHYANGMSSIPVSSSWILRKQNTDNPSLSSVNSFYGNLKIENTSSSFWNATTVGSKITGISSAPVIKGTMEIGTSGNNGIKFYSENSATSPVLIKKDLLIGQSSELCIADANTTPGSSGIEIQGNFTLDGILSYDLTDANNQNRMLKFSGTTDQYISGNGTLHLYNCSLNKSSGTLFLNRNISIDHKLFLNNGKLDLNKNLLTLQNSATDAIERTNAWIKSEVFDHTSRIAWNIGTTAGVHTFPFGKDENNFIPFSVFITNGDLGLFTVSTYGTAPDNLPLPVLPESVHHLVIHGTENAPHTADRFWYITSSETSGTATLSFSYANGEGPLQESDLLARKYNSLSETWEEPLCCQIQNTLLHTVMVPGVQSFSHWTLMNGDDALALKENKPSQKAITEILPHANSCFPIPFRDELFIKETEEQEGDFFIEVINSLGVTIFRENFTYAQGINYRLNFSSISEKGIFYIKRVSASSVKEFKVLRE